MEICQENEVTGLLETEEGLSQRYQFAAKRLHWSLRLSFFYLLLYMLFFLFPCFKLCWYIECGSYVIRVLPYFERPSNVGSHLEISGSPWT